MAPTYEFTSDVPLIFSELSHSDGVTVERADSVNDAEGVDGSTVVLYPGDILTVPEEIEHAWLTEHAAVEVKSATKAQVKATQKLAAEIVPGEVVNADGSPSTDLTPATPEDITAASASGEPIADAIVGETTITPEGDQS